MIPFKRYFSLGAGVLAALVYGALTHLVFAQDTQLVGTLSVSFVVLVPPVLGFLTVSFATPAQKKSWKYFIFAPWLSCGLCMALAGIFLLEAWFCILLAAPLWLALASAGGAVAALVSELAQKRGSNDVIWGALLLFTLTPFLFVPLERLLPLQPEMRTVHSQIVRRQTPRGLQRER